MKKTVTRILLAALCALLVTSMLPISVSAAKASTVAHWKFQNTDGYSKGTINQKDFGFYDLTGNGNDLIVAYEGNAADINGGIFAWAKGSDNDAKSDSALYFGNTIDAAKSVDPYTATETEYGGAYTSGMYFETIDNAPINKLDFEKGFTIEVVFMVDSTFNMNYNRYTGIISRQGLFNNEPMVSLALAECSADDKGYFTDRMGLQYLQNPLDLTATTNSELAYDEGIDPGVWVHYCVIVSGGSFEAYVNGQFITGGETGDGIAQDGYGWDVGVGRKDLSGKASMNENYPEGGIRRLFCGTISEIRISDGAMDIEDSLWGQTPVYDLAWQTPAAPEAVEAPTETPVETLAETPAVEEAPVVTAPAAQTSDIAVTALVAIIAAGYALIKKRG